MTVVNNINGDMVLSYDMEVTEDGIIRLSMDVVEEYADIDMVSDMLKLVTLLDGYKLRATALDAMANLLEVYASEAKSAVDDMISRGSSC